ncbi:uncharacterized protein LOC128152413 [Harpia harpyja]|uniref:uncharacterized protein LOC128152413 n=1 Tax=Harpia harpyja TaxID=202280 RepID=UPI0022B13B15|nr:uncharacterized protein LOC128152413 [Harpia harpyja]
MKKFSSDEEFIGFCYRNHSRHAERWEGQAAPQDASELPLRVRSGTAPALQTTQLATKYFEQAAPSPPPPPGSRGPAPTRRGGGRAVQAALTPAPPPTRHRGPSPGPQRSQNARHAWKLAQRTKNVRLGGWNELPLPLAAEGGYCPCPPGTETGRRKRVRGEASETRVPRSTRALVVGRNTSVTCQWLGTTCSTEQHFAEFNFRNYFASPGSSLLSTPTFLTYQHVSKRRCFGLTFTIASKEYNALSKLKSTASGILYKVETMGLS